MYKNVCQLSVQYDIVLEREACMREHNSIPQGYSAHTIVTFSDTRIKCPDIFEMIRHCEVLQLIVVIREPSCVETGTIANYLRHQWVASCRDSLPSSKPPSLTCSTSTTSLQELDLW